MTGEHRDNFKGRERDQQDKSDGENRRETGKKDSNSSDHNPGSQSQMHSLNVPMRNDKNISEGSSLITGDSGYLSSPCNTASGKVTRESPSKDLMKAHAAMMPSQEVKSRKATMGELLEKRLIASKSSPESQAKFVTEDYINTGSIEKVSSSPRMKEGLFKKLDQQPVKKGVMREELMAAKVKNPLASGCALLMISTSSVPNKSVKGLIFLRLLLGACQFG